MGSAESKSQTSPATFTRRHRYILNRVLERPEDVASQTAAAETPAAVSWLTPVVHRVAGLVWLDEERGKSPSLVYEWASMVCVWKQKTDGSYIIAILKGGFENNREGKSSLWAELGAVHSAFYGMRSGPSWEYIQIAKKCPIPWPACHGPRKERNRRSETRSPGVGAWGWTWEWAQRVKSFQSHFDVTRKHSVWKSHRKPSRQNDLARQCYPAFAISRPGSGLVGTLLARSLWRRWVLCLDPTEGTPFVLVYLDTDASECPNCYQQKPTLSTILWRIYFGSKEITSWKE